MAKTKKTRGGLAPRKYLSPEQIHRLRRYVKDQTARAKVNGNRRAVINEVIIDTMLNSGLRAAEICQLQMRDMPHNHGKNIIFVQEGKGRIERSVMVSSKLAERIKHFVKRYRKGSKPNSFLFMNEQGGPLSYRSLYSKMKLIGKASGLGRLTPHMLRHTYAMEWYKKTQDLFGLQDQLGHADTKMTHIYARTTDERMRKMAEDFDL